MGEMDKDNKKNRIVIRSEEVQEIMSEIPNWIIRWGISLLLFILVLVLSGSFFFKYPDIIETTMTLTSLKPVSEVLAHSSGRISNIYIKNNQNVQSGSVLGVISNSASTQDVFWLKEKISKLMDNPDSAAHILLPVKELALGNIQSTYSSYTTALHNYSIFYSLDYFSKRIQVTEEQITKNREHYKIVEQQYDIMRRQYLIEHRQFARDSSLYVRGVISDSEYDKAKTTLLQSEYSLSSNYSSLSNTRLLIGQLEENLLDLKLQKMEKEKMLYQDYHSNAEQLMNEIKEWEINYLLVAPIDGKVTFTKYWSENQNVTNSDVVFSIIPDAKEKLIGKTLLPLEGSGKVKVGQRVIIRFLNFPDKEFGTVEGIVSNISLVPAEDNYTVEIELPNGLKTNYGMTLPILQEMQAKADIVTQDLRLIERFFMPIKQMFLGN